MGLAQQVAKLYLSKFTGSAVRTTRYPLAAIGVKCTCSGHTVAAYGWSAAYANALILAALGSFAAGYKIVAIGTDTPSVLGTYVIRFGHSPGNANAATVMTGMVMVDWRTLAGPGAQIHVEEPAWVAYDNAADAPTVEATSGTAAQDDTIYVSGIIAVGMGT